MDIEIRKFIDSDLPFLKQMLFEAVYWNSGNNKPDFEEGLSRKGVREAIEDFGKYDDDFASVAKQNGSYAGAAWYRTYEKDKSIRGYVDADTPVAVIAVQNDSRRKGIGDRLLKGLIENARSKGFDKISLCVTKSNHALKLYRNNGFVEHEDLGDSLIMILDLN